MRFELHICALLSHLLLFWQLRMGERGRPEAFWKGSNFRNLQCSLAVVQRPLSCSARPHVPGGWGIAGHSEGTLRYSNPVCVSNRLPGPPTLSASSMPSDIHSKQASAETCRFCEGSKSYSFYKENKRHFGVLEGSLIHRLKHCVSVMLVVSQFKGYWLVGTISRRSIFHWACDSIAV